MKKMYILKYYSTIISGSKKDRYLSVNWIMHTTKRYGTETKHFQANKFQKV